MLTMQHEKGKTEWSRLVAPPFEATNKDDPYDIHVIKEGEYDEHGDTPGTGCLPHGGVLSSAITFSVSTIGAGVLTLPLAFADGGTPFAMFILIVIPTYTVISIRYLVRVIEVTGLRSFEDMARMLLGPRFEHSIRLMIILFLFGVCIGYSVVLADCLEPLRKYPWIPEWLQGDVGRTNSMLLFFVVFLGPIALVRQINTLRFSALFGIVSMLYITAAVVFRYFFPYAFLDAKGVESVDEWVSHHRHPHNTESSILLKFIAMPLMMFSFDCQALVFKVHSEMTSPHMANVTRTAILTVILCGSVNFCVGYFGDKSFPGNVGGNILLHYDPRHDVVMAFAYAACAVTVTTASAMVLFPCKDAIYGVMHGYVVGGEEVPFMTHVVTSLGLQGAAVALSLAVPSIATIVSVLGAMCSSTMCYTLPASYVLVMHYKSYDRVESAWSRLVMWSMLALGIGGGLLGTVVSILRVYSGPLGLTKYLDAN